MRVLKDQPSLSELMTLIDKVPKYPISVKQLIDLATLKKTSKKVIDFYKTFPENEVFEDEEDLVARTEQVELMHEEDQPKESLVSSEED